MRTIFPLLVSTALCGCLAPVEPVPGPIAVLEPEPEPEPEPALDVLDRLLAIEGMTAVEAPTENPGYRKFQLSFEQLADHQDLNSARFAQRMILLHRDERAPMVLFATGYALFEDRYGDFLAEPTVALQANQLLVEHRYFPGSRPDADWSLMNVRQAADDHHTITNALKDIFAAKWIGTGWSKGGMTVLFHERFHPGDLDGVVAYVAPISLGAPDKRYVDHLAQLGPDACRADLETMQRSALERLDALVDVYEPYAQPGVGRDLLQTRVVDAVINFEWMYWQYYGAPYCDLLLPAGAPLDEYLNWLPVDVYLEYEEEPETAAYFYQAGTELGFPSARATHLVDLLPAGYEVNGGINDFSPAPWGDEALSHSGLEMVRVRHFLAEQGTNIIAVYGEYDPWTGGRIDLDERNGSRVFVAPGANHGATLSQLSINDQTLALSRLAELSEVELQAFGHALSDRLRIAGHKQRALMLDDGAWDRLLVRP